MGTRWERWLQAVEGDERVGRTVSEEGEYRMVYERASQGVVGSGFVGDRVVDPGAGEVVMAE